MRALGFTPARTEQAVLEVTDLSRPWFPNQRTVFPDTELQLVRFGQAADEHHAPIALPERAHLKDVQLVDDIVVYRWSSDCASCEPTGVGMTLLDPTEPAMCPRARRRYGPCWRSSCWLHSRSCLFGDCGLQLDRYLRR
jgi:hypothetical protein